jgi:PPOX class probable F420-dependent enzyme
MTTDTIPQGDLALLDHPVASKLLDSAIPARVGYLALDGTPRVTPMWFTWNGTELVFGAAGTAPKVKALQANPRVAVTIDSDTAPYKVLTIRGDAQVTIVEGAVDEYADAALRYFGPTQGAGFRDHAKATMRGMARITIKPDWVSLIDFQTRYPSSY